MIMSMRVLSRIFRREVFSQLFSGSFVFAILDFEDPEF